MFLQKVGRFPKKVFGLFKARSISTQLIITIILIFASFFVLQAFLNAQFFKNYYTEQEFNDIHADLMTYVEDMNRDEADFYDEMYEFNNKKCL